MLVMLESNERTASEPRNSLSREHALCVFAINGDVLVMPSFWTLVLKSFFD